jgi:RND family efflux transporter MFP subunit
MKSPHLFFTLTLAGAFVSGCKQAPPPPAAPPPTPVQASVVANSAVPTTDTYVSTIKSRRSATLSPQVDGNITRIFVKSGDLVKAGQVLMQIDPLKQVATVQSQQGTEQQQKALYQYNQADLARQKALYEAGVISKQAYEISLQSAQNSKGAFDSASALTNTQQEQLAYYKIRAPFDGIVGDIPVHVGDYVTPAAVPSTVLTTVDENNNLEAYIYIPTERATQVKKGLAVDVLDTAGNLLTHSTIDFVSLQVDNGLQSVLAKAPIPASTHLRNGQLVNARVTYATNQIPTVPILAVVRIGGQSFVYVAAPAPKGNGYAAHQTLVNLGEPVGNIYPVLSGLKTGDRVILSGTQFLFEGAPVQPLAPQPTAAPASPPS